MLIDISQLKTRDIAFIGKGRVAILEINDFDKWNIDIKYITLLDYKIRNYRFKSNSSLELMRTYRESLTYKGLDDNGLMIMVKDDGSEFKMNKRAIVNHGLLNIGRRVNGLFNCDDDIPVFCYLPLYISEKVLSLGEISKSRGNLLRWARICDGNTKILVPHDIKVGDMITIDTKSSCYKGKSRKS